MPPLFRHRHRLLSGSVAIPVITGFSPAAGAVGDVVTITGSNFGAAQGVGSVVFTNLAAPFSNSVSALNTLSWSDTQIVVKVPDGLSFPYANSFMRVTTNTAQSANSASTFLWTGGAAGFTAASSQVLTHADSATLGTGDIDFTIAAWVRLSATATSQTVAGKTGANLLEWLLRYDTTASNFRFFLSSDGSSAAGTVDATNFAGSFTAWNFVVAWHDSVNNFTNIAVNAVAANQTAYAAGTTRRAGAFDLGGRSLQATNFLGGQLDGVCFWKRVLTAGERTTLYNAGQGLSYASALALGGGLLTSLAAWWDLDDAGGSGATWVDRLGVSNLTAGTGAAAPTSVRGVR
jgi:hypothetical protein